MMNLSYKIFNFVGAPVKFSLTFLFFFLLLPFDMVISAFIAILVHEMAHAYVANYKGYRVNGIDIGLMMGSASYSGNIHQRDTIPITAAGPLSNLALYLIGFVVSFFVDHSFVNNFMWVNLFLFVFNILPIIPMDGGVILKNFLFKYINNRRKARIITSKVSLVTSVIVMCISFGFGYFFAGLFMIYFIYLALVDLGYIQKFKSQGFMNKFKSRSSGRPQSGTHMRRNNKYN